jgi:hypothetical protein
MGCHEAERRSPRRGKRGSHRKWVNPATGESRPLPDWGPQDLKIGTIEAIVKGLGLDWDEFRSLSRRRR